MQQENLVQKLCTLQEFYNEVYLLSSYKSRLICNKECNFSIKIESNTFNSHFHFIDYKKPILINFLTEMIFEKIANIKAIEAELNITNYNF